MLRRLSAYCAASAVLVGFLVLLGWALDLPALESVLPGLATMKPNTAAALLLAGLALWWLRDEGASRWVRNAGAALAGAVALVAALTLAQYAAGVDLGIDGLLRAVPPAPAAYPYPLRMAPATASCLLLLGLGLLALRAGRFVLAQLAALGVAATALVAVVGYAYGVHSLYAIGPFASVALHTALALLVLAAGLLAARPDRGLIVPVTSSGDGGLAARRLLPFAVLVPVFLGWLRLEGQRAGLYDTVAGVALFAVSLVFVSVGGVWWTAASLHRLGLERRQAEEARRTSEERFRLLADALPEIVADIRPDGSVEYCSPYFFRYIGLVPGGDLRQQWLSAIHPGDSERVLEIWQRAWESGGPCKVDYRLRRADGVYRWHEVRVLPVRDAVTGLTKWVAIGTDVDDRKRAQSEIERYTGDLERSNAELANFAYVASHDLQEPLRTLAGFSELLLARYQGRLDDQADEFLGFIRDGASRMQALVSDLLAYSRVGTQGAPFEPVDCDRLLREALHDLRVAIAESGAEVTSDPLPVVRGDARQLAQVFRNLIGNGLKYRRDGIPPRIHVRAEDIPGARLFSVRDNGLGIEAQHSQRIFAIFQRLHGRNEYGGTGIGLAICKKVVERHGGRIWVDSQPGEGSTFLFTLPEVEEKPS
jgi:PAS domain S-box-containing protein